MFFFFVFFFLLIIGCDGIQSEEAGDQFAEHKRLLLNNPQAMDDRLINLERKFQAVNGKMTALENENSLLKSTMAANTQTTNSKIEMIKSQLANGGMFYILTMQSIMILLMPVCAFV